MSGRHLIPAFSRRPACAVAAGLAGLVASYLGIPILPGIHVTFAGVFYLWAAIVCGPLGGAVAAAIAMVGTVPLQGHPYSLILAVLEAVGLGYLCRRGRRLWPPAASVLFWAAVGLPFLLLVLFGLLGFSGTTAWEIVVKRILNGFVNALLADFLSVMPWAVFFTGAPRGSRPSGTLREVLATGLLVMTLLPILLFSIGQCRTFADHEQRQAIADVGRFAGSVRLQLDAWISHYAQHFRAAVAGNRAAESGVLRVDAIDADGRVTKMEWDGAAPLNEPGGAGQRWFATALSEYRQQPAIAITVTRADGGAIRGFVGLSGLRRFGDSLARPAETDWVLLDRDNRVLYSSPARNKAPLARISASELASRWEGHTRSGFDWSRMTLEPPHSTVVGNRSDLTGWQVVASRGLSPVQQQIEAYYLRTLLWLLGAAIVSCGLAALIARRITRPLEKLLEALREYRIGEPWTAPLPIGGAVPELMQIQEQFSEFSRRLAESKAANERALEEKDRLNQELKRLVSDMDRNVQARTAELSEARQRAEAANEAKSLFLASMSHEIRTPLNAIVGISDLLASHNLNAEEQSLTETIQTSARGLMALINDILDFSKIESGKLELGNFAFDPRDIAESVASVVALAAHAKGVEITCRVAREVPRSLMGDPDRLQQVVMNLASNAVKFTAAGEVAISLDVLEREASTVTLRFRIRDTGVGIRAEAQSRLFQPFSQADASTTRQFGGTGLGLAVSKRLTEQMGGEIGLVSEEGRGSTFWCTFRLNVPDAQARPESAPDFEARVLVVDDNASAREGMLEDLAALGFPAEATADGETAMEMILAAASELRPYAAVVIDFGLPDHDGIPLGTAIRACPDCAGVALILLRSQSERLNGPENAGLEPYVPLRKPVRRRKLLECLLDLGLVRGQGAPVQRAAAESRHNAAPVPPAPNSRRILLVEDNLVNQKVASKMLERLGYEADVAPNGAAALEALEQKSYSAVLMDCQMPVMDGFEATREIRRRANGNGRTVVIAMTANAYAEDRERCRQAGMDDYLAKPVALESLASALKRWTEMPGGSELEGPVRQPVEGVPR